MSDKYTIGIDFGTLSGRALLVRLSDGEELANAVMDYPHAVIDERLPASGEILPPDFALQDPRDYLDVLRSVVPEVIRAAGVSADNIVGVGVDFTCCTMLPVADDGNPLCFSEKFAREPHAYVKLWKHHAAQSYADRLNEVALERGEPWLANYGGKISSEWMFPKIWEIYDKAPEIYAAAARFCEAGDWITGHLTGKPVKSYVYAASKAIYDYDSGYPDREFFAALEPGLADVVGEKLNADMVYPGQRAGFVCDATAAELGLSTSCAVGCPMPDAHVAPAALGMNRSGDMCAVMGTSSCYMLISDKPVAVGGICGVLRDSMIPGFTGYEAGLCCVGDHFAWAAETVAPPEYIREARERCIPVRRLLIEKAAEKKPGESGLLALDWWNGNRSVLIDSDLSGLILGLCLRTKPEDIMRALIEATAFGTRVIFDNYRENGIEIKRLIAAGGIARRDSFTMQLYADILGTDITVAGSSQVPARGSAVFAAAAAGIPLDEAMSTMCRLSDKVYKPDRESEKIYDALYAEYLELYRLFGRGECNVMKRLKKIKSGVCDGN